MFTVPGERLRRLVSPPRAPGYGSLVRAMAIERFGPARELTPIELEDAARAQERVEEGHVGGKLVLRVHA
jgi:hypothetical protein